MGIRGEYTVAAPSTMVWEALLDPDVLVKCIPGCEELKLIGEDTYGATIVVGIGAIKGRYQGKVRLSDMERLKEYRMSVEGGGRPGTVRGTSQMKLASTDSGTVVTVNASYQTTGLIASVGQRLLGVISKRMLDEFFKNLRKEIGKRGLHRNSKP